MASKKDKLKQAAEKQARKVARPGEGSSMSELVQDIERDRQAKNEPNRTDEPRAVESAVPETSPEPSAAGVSPPEKTLGAGMGADMVVEVSARVEEEEPSGAGDSGKDDSLKSSASSAGSRDQSSDNTNENILIPRQDRGRDNGPSQALGRSPGGSPGRGSAALETNNMAKTRDSIYNVSSDIRLEDYTDSRDSGGGGGGLGRIVKIVGILAAVVILWWFLSGVFGWLFAPGYKLAVANQLISAADVEKFAENNVVSSSSEVFFRFQWEEGDIHSEMLRIKIEIEEKGDFAEYSGASTRLPAGNYMPMVVSLRPGSYRIIVSDKENNVLKEKHFKVK